jgi:hypothetical protein
VTLKPAADFISKIYWEGGISGAIDYGLDATEYELPGSVKDAWRQLRAMAATYNTAQEQFAKIAKEAGVDLDSEGDDE